MHVPAALQDGEVLHVCHTLPGFSVVVRGYRKAKPSLFLTFAPPRRQTSLPRAKSKNVHLLAPPESPTDALIAAENTTASERSLSLSDGLFGASASSPSRLSFASTDGLLGGGRRGSTGDGLLAAAAATVAGDVRRHSMGEELSGGHDRAGRRAIVHKKVAARPVLAAVRQRVNRRVRSHM